MPSISNAWPCGRATSLLATLVGLAVSAANVGCGPSSSSEGGSGTSDSGTGDDDGPFPPSCATAGAAGVCDEPDAVLCGNGTLDGCEICFSSDDGPLTCEQVVESCEGTNLGGGTCASLGFVGGQLACDAGCRFDARDCDACVQRPGLSCVRPRVDAVEAFRFAIASRGDVLAAAWDTLDDVVHVATWDAELELVGEQPCMPGPVGVASLALGPTAGGFLLAIGTGGDAPVIEIQALDVSAVRTGTPRVIENASSPAFVARPGAGPLLAHASTDFAGASETPTLLELVDDAGQPVWQTLLEDPAMPDSLSGAFVGDTFLVARAPTPATADGSWVIPVALDGTAGAPTWHDGVRALALAPASDSRAAATWLQGDTYFAGRLDATGAIFGTPVPIAMRDPSVVDQAHVVASTGSVDFAALVEGVRHDLRATHLGDDAILDAYLLASEPEELGPLVAAVLGTDIVVGWLAGSDRLSLARVTP